MISFSCHTSSIISDRINIDMYEYVSNRNQLRYSSYYLAVIAADKSIPDRKREKMGKDRESLILCSRSSQAKLCATKKIWHSFSLSFR